LKSNDLRRTDGGEKFDPKTVRLLPNHFPQMPKSKSRWRAWLTLPDYQLQSARKGGPILGRKSQKTGKWCRPASVACQPDVKPGNSGKRRAVASLARNCAG
jgi:hypothetical protein